MMRWCCNDPARAGGRSSRSGPVLVVGVVPFLAAVLVALETQPDLRAMNAGLRGRLDADMNLIALDSQDLQLDPAIDHDGFACTSSEYEHSLSPLAQPSGGLERE